MPFVFLIDKWDSWSSFQTSVVFYEVGDFVSLCKFVLIDLN